MTGQQARQALIDSACELDEAGFMPNKSGNLSCRWTDGVLITPSALPYAGLKPEDIMFLDLDGTVRTGGHKPSSETPFHTGIYRARPDINAVVHTHSPKATALACARRSIPPFHYMIALAGGGEIPCLEYATFGTAALAEKAVTGLAGRKAVLLANHGVIAAGEDIGEARAVAIEVENLAGEYLALLSAGLQPVLLDVDEMSRVMKQFAIYR